MAVQDVKARLKDQKPEDAVVVQYDFGDNLQAALAKFGEEVVFNKFVDAVTIDLQAMMRRMIAKGKTPAEIAEAAKTWSPSSRQVVIRSASEKLEDIFGKMTPEQRKEALEKMRALMKAA